MATSIRLEPEIEQRLDYLATQTGRTKAYYLREIIKQGLEDVEDIYLADKALEDIRAGKGRTYTTDEVRKELGLDD
ncbi:MAG: ribbon-helix-helix protein, CopG family [Methylococcaceae bacterium]|nr:ribbon-helix-helix protein, CopG family [Methylococcaceae bacterium]